MRSLFFGLLSLILASSSSAQDTLEQQANALEAAIKQIRAVKQPLHENDGPTIARIVSGMSELYYTSDVFKKQLFRDMGRSRYEKIAKAANPEHRAILNLMYYTRQGVFNNYTDEKLAGFVGRKAIVQQRIAERIWKNPKITEEDIAALEGFDPETAARLTHVISLPWFIYKPSPAGGYMTTAAAGSLWQAYFHLRIAEIAERSIVVRLLLAENLLYLPATTYIEFRYSGWKAIPIVLKPVGLTRADIPELQRLTANPLYRALAEHQLAQLQ